MGVIQWLYRGYIGGCRSHGGYVGVIGFRF